MQKNREKGSRAEPQAFALRPRSFLFSPRLCCSRTFSASREPPSPGAALGLIPPPRSGPGSATLRAAGLSRGENPGGPNGGGVRQRPEGTGPAAAGAGMRSPGWWLSPAGSRASLPATWQAPRLLPPGEQPRSVPAALPRVSEPTRSGHRGHRGGSGSCAAPGGDGRHPDPGTGDTEPSAARKGSPHPAPYKPAAWLPGQQKTGQD